MGKKNRQDSLFSYKIDDFFFLTNLKNKKNRKDSLSIISKLLTLGLYS